MISLESHMNRLEELKEKAAHDVVTAAQVQQVIDGVHPDLEDMISLCATTTYNQWVLRHIKRCYTCKIYFRTVAKREGHPELFDFEK